MATHDVPAAEAEARFSSLAAMQGAHRELLRASKEKPPDFRDRVLDFLEQGRRTGAVLDTLEERSSAQSLLDYWTATLYSLPLKPGESTRPAVPDAVLTEFDAAALQSAARAAEETLASLSLTDQEVARRVLLQLVHLSPDGRSFELVSARQDALESRGKAGQVQSLLERLRSAGAVRVLPGEQPGRGQVCLRYAALIREWVRLRTWLEQRARFREAAINWEQHGRSPATLARGSWLGEALGYHDLSGLEQEFIQASQRGEVRHSRVLRAVALTFFVLALVAGIGWRKANQEKERAEQALKDVDKARAEAERALQESERSRALFKEVDEWRKQLLSNDTLRESVLKAPSSEKGVLRAPQQLQEYAQVLPERETFPYDPGFLDAAVPVPLPGMRPELQRQTHGRGRVLDYGHYSLVVHAERAMALYTAANHDRALGTEIPHKIDPGRGWFDPRVPRELQVGGEVYEQEDFSQGHLVALNDILWGPAQLLESLDFAFYAYTNSVPQYAPFQQGLWSQLEQYTRTQHNPQATKVSLFTGPVFRDSDYVYRGIRVPRTFWKIAVSPDMNDANALVVDAFLADQYDPAAPTRPLSHPTDSKGRIDPKGYRTSVENIEALTGLDFGVLRKGRPTRPGGVLMPP
jgi:DNA/RNA endonuclease G (NUC1)